MYSVKYRVQGRWFWKRIKNVKGDGIITENGNRYFILSNEERIEIPKNSEVVFSVERHLQILTQMEKEAGIKIPVKEG